MASSNFFAITKRDSLARGFRGAMREMKVRIIKRANLDETAKLHPLWGTSSTRSPIPRVIARETRSARQEARAILRDAEQRATEHIEKTKIEAAYRLEAFQDALNESLRGFEEECRALRERDIATQTQSLIPLATRIAEKIIRREVTLSPESVLEIVEKVLYEERARLDLTQPVTVRVHPRMKEFMEHHRARLAALMEHYEVSFVGDDTIDEGGCVLESRHYVFDARISTQLDAIASALSQTS